MCVNSQPEDSDVEGMCFFKKRQDASIYLTRDLHTVVIQ